MMSASLATEKVRSTVISVSPATVKATSVMKIEIENLGIPQRDFHLVREALIAQNKKFDAITLPQIPYNQLILCCTGVAGSTACPPQLIRKEKQHRRERFLDLEEQEFQECINFLQIERMYEDVQFALAQRAAPAWNSLASRQKVWFKLNCLFNHIDAPQRRIGETILLLRTCAEEPNSGLPREVCEHYIDKLQTLFSSCMEISQVEFRQKIWDIAEIILDFLPDSERSICTREELQDYSCTSDCFRVLS
jgi:hypothetical protein